MQRLVEAEDDRLLARGTVFQFSGSYPYEAVARLMLFAPIPSTPRPLGLMVVGGYKSGLPLVVLLSEACPDGSNTTCGWIKSNWKKWIYPECAVEDIWFLEDIAEAFADLG